MRYNPHMINAIIEEARKHPYEIPWIEFKHNKYTPQDIGEYISALANALLCRGRFTPPRHESREIQ